MFDHSNLQFITLGILLTQNEKWRGKLIIKNINKKFSRKNRWGKIKRTFNPSTPLSFSFFVFHFLSRVPPQGNTLFYYYLSFLFSLYFFITCDLSTIMVLSFLLDGQIIAGIFSCLSVFFSLFLIYKVWVLLYCIFMKYFHSLYFAHSNKTLFTFYNFSN